MTFYDSILKKKSTICDRPLGSLNYAVPDVFLHTRISKGGKRAKLRNPTYVCQPTSRFFLSLIEVLCFSGVYDSFSRTKLYCSAVRLVRTGPPLH